AQWNVDKSRCRRFHMRAFAESEVQRDRRRGFGNDDRHVMALHQQRKLLLQIVLEELWPGDRRRIDAGCRDVAVGETGVDMAETRRLDADLRVEGTVPGGDRCTLREPREAVDQEGGVALVECRQRLDGFYRIIEGLRLERGRRRNVERGQGIDSFAHEAL